METHTSQKSIPGTQWEGHFRKFREQIVGIDAEFVGPYGPKPVIYADWIASGRLYGPIEEKMHKDFGPYVANTHTETSYTGMVMTQAYDRAKQMIKKHVNASKEDVFIPTGTGMTGAVLKFQRILGLKVPEQFTDQISLSPEQRPVVFISHMEHHSNQTSWLETIAEVIQINPDEKGLLDLNHFAELLEQYKDRPYKIASITSCSNVTGVFTPYHEVAKMIHQANGFCFVDFACSGPYVDINMHPDEEDAYLDAIFFSPHKFLGGPGTPGVLIFNSKLYKNRVPDHPGGGTVTFTNPWGGHYYIEDIETREDGGTPGFLQTMRAALAIELKEQMTVEAIEAREKEILAYVFERLEKLPGMVILAGHLKDRLGAISFYLEGVHYNLVVQLLNDLFGIQTRGGCSCAGTYGHYLLHLDPETSKQVSEKVNQGDFSVRPGWIRLSLHPTFTDEEVIKICDAIEHVAHHWQDYANDYQCPLRSNTYINKDKHNDNTELLDAWFHLD